MAQFVAFNPNVEVSGRSLAITIEAMGEAIRPVLSQFGFSHVDQNAWYPLQDLLDLFREIASGDFQSTLDLVGIGMKAPGLAFWPPEIQDIVDALYSIDAAYKMNHRNGEIGHYRTSQVGDREMEIYAENPYPCDMDYGIIYGIARQYLKSPETLVVEHLHGECRKNNGETCTYRVRW